jgi:hypothetical protein
MLSELTFMISAAKGGSTSTFWTTLLGAVVGGCVSLATTLLVERQRSKAANTAETRRDEAAARLAGRVIALELRDIESVLRVALERSPFAWPPAADFAFAAAAWSAHAGQLGAVVPDDVWEEVALPYSSFEYANLLGSVNAASARTMLHETQSAIAALDGWATKAK